MGGNVGNRRQRRQATWAGIGIIAAIFALVASCTTTKRTILAPPQIPGATYVGSEQCATCHDDIAHDFQTATHSRLMAKGKNAEGEGCESCHGPGSLHVEAGGSKGTIINPNKSPETCFQCHLEKRAEFNLPYTHPVLDGKMTCTECHDPHKGDAVSSGGTNFESQNDKCFTCHKMQRGPFTFQHEAVREGCTSCHAPHGSVNQKMLTERNATLCLKCHFQQQTAFGQILIGGRNHAGFLSRGTCWSAGCHEAVHGSYNHPSLRF